MEEECSLRRWPEGEWSFYRGGKFNGGRIKGVSLMYGEWSCYGGGQFNGGRIPMLQFNGGRMVVTVAILMEGEWSCYRGGQFNGGRMVMLQRWSV